MGVLTNCIRAGQANCAMDAFMPGVGAIQSGIEGAMSGGTLKDAKMVTLSRRQKRVYEIFGILGTGGGVGAEIGFGPVDVEGGGDAPKSFANLASLYTQIAIFTLVVETNLAVPGVTFEKD